MRRRDCAFQWNLCGCDGSWWHCGWSSACTSSAPTPTGVHSLPIGQELSGTAFPLSLSLPLCRRALNPKTLAARERSPQRPALSAPPRCSLSLPQPSVPTRRASAQVPTYVRPAESSDPRTAPPATPLASRWALRACRRPGLATPYVPPPLLLLHLAPTPARHRSTISNNHEPSPTMSPHRQ